MIAHLSPKERFGYACLIGLLLFAFGFVGARHLRQPAPIVFEQTPDPRTVNSAGQAMSSPPVPAPVVVHVVGSVRNPGVVRLPEGSRVEDAIAQAGGALADANVSELNLAAKVEDGTQIRVMSRAVASAAIRTTTVRQRPKTEIDTSTGFAPVLVEPTQLVASSQTTAPSVSKTKPDKAPSRSKKVPSAVSINTASVVELQSLPGVGPTTAQKIVAFRQQNGPFKTAEELLDVPGIGEKKLAKMLPFVKL